MIEVHFILNILVCFLALAIALLFVLHIIEMVAFHGAGRKSKLRQLMSVVLFSLLLIIPVLNIDWIGGKCFRNGEQGPGRTPIFN